MPSSYSVMDMGYADYGGGPRGAHDGMALGGSHAGMKMPAGRSVADLTVGTHRPADEVVDLVARKQRFALPSGQTVDGYTINGRSPGPLIVVTEGQLLEVHLHNRDVPDGITLHWHGVDVPNAEDGVAGVTQDAVLPGHSYTYRFVARRTGTYWYHSHQVSHEQVIRGLLGPLVVLPEHPDKGVRDVVAVSHTYDGIATVNGRRTLPVEARPGQRVRVRVVNTDNGPTRAWSDVPFRLVSVDGHAVNRPTTVHGKAVVVTAGGRDDLEVTAPADGSSARVQIGSGTAVVVGRDPRSGRPLRQPPDNLDLLTYGSPAPLGFDPDHAERHFTYDIGRRLGFVHGKPGMWWTVNGHLFPDMAPLCVKTQRGGRS